MNPPNSDGKGPGTQSGTSAPTGGESKSDSSKREAGKATVPMAGQTKLETKPEPVKPDSPPPSAAAKPGATDSSKPAGPPPSSVQKPAETQPADVKKVDTNTVSPNAARDTPDLPATGNTRVEPPKPASATAEATKPSGAKPGISEIDPIKAGSSATDTSPSAGPGSTPPRGTGSTSSSMGTEAAKPGAASGGAQTPVQGGAITDGPIIDLKAKRLPDPGEASVSGATKPGGSGTFNPGADKNVPASASKPTGTSTPKIGPTPATTGDAGRKGLGAGSLVAAGLLGGVLGAGLLLAAERSGTLDSGEDGRLTALEQKIATLAPKDALASLDKRLGVNESAVKTLPDAIRSADATAKEALQKVGSASTATAADTAASAPGTLPPDLMARLDGLDQRVAALQEEPGREQSGATSVAGIDASTISGLEERLKAVEVKVDGTGKADPANSSSSAVAALKIELDNRIKANSEANDALSQKFASLQQILDDRMKSATEALQKATQASQQAVDASQAQAAENAKGVERQIQVQSEKIAGLNQALAGRAETATVQAGLRIVAADRIVSALNTGTPYADALEALRNLELGDPARLNVVATFADRGAPTARQLSAEFRPIVERLIASRKASQAKAVAETGDVKQRLFSMAEAIVQVRKVDAPISSTEATSDDALSQVQGALDRGAITDAARIFASLPEDVRTQASDFGTKLTSRAAAGEAAQALLADAFRALPSTGATR